MFTKVKDNTVRTILCTINAHMIPAKFTKSVTSIYSPPENPDIFPIWDVREDKWKSFKITNAIQFKTSDEILKMDIGRLNVKSNIREQLKEMKEKVYKEFEERVQNLKEESEASRKRTEEKLQQARDIINRLRNESQDRLNGGS